MSRDQPQKAQDRSAGKGPGLPRAYGDADMTSPHAQGSGDGDAQTLGSAGGGGPGTPHIEPGGAGSVASAPVLGPSDAEDLRLASAARGGDASAWSALLSRYQDRIYGLCLRMFGDRDRAADSAQDAMVRIIEGLGSFDGRSRLSTWIVRVTMNVCFSRLRSEKIRRHGSLDSVLADRAEYDGGATRGRGAPAESLAADDAGGEPLGLANVQRGEVQRRVLASLDQMNAEQRAILVLRDCRDLDYDQIAEVLGVPVGTVKSRLFRARAALREILEASGGVPGFGAAQDAGKSTAGPDSESDVRSDSGTYGGSNSRAGRSAKPKRDAG